MAEWVSHDGGEVNGIAVGLCDLTDDQASQVRVSDNTIICQFSESSSRPTQKNMDAIKAMCRKTGLENNSSFQEIFDELSMKIANTSFSLIQKNLEKNHK